MSAFDKAHMTFYSTLIETIVFYSILYRFRDIASYLSKVGDFNPPHVHLVPVGVDRGQISGYLWHQKTRFSGLSCGIVCVILCLAVLTQYRFVTDRQTDGHTTTEYIALA